MGVLLVSLGTDRFRGPVSLHTNPGPLWCLFKPRIGQVVSLRFLCKNKGGPLKRSPQMASQPICLNLQKEIKGRLCVSSIPQRTPKYQIWKTKSLKHRLSGEFPDHTAGRVLRMSSRGFLAACLKCDHPRGYAQCQTPVPFGTMKVL